MPRIRISRNRVYMNRRRLDRRNVSLVCFGIARRTLRRRRPRRKWRRWPLRNVQRRSWDRIGRYVPPDVKVQTWFLPEGLVGARELYAFWLGGTGAFDAEVETLGIMLRNERYFADLVQIWMRLTCGPRSFSGLFSYRLSSVA